MRTRLTLFFGIFSVMALSNAIVPVLSFYGSASSLHGLIYAAYFLGAFATTLPGGILSDRFGRIPLMRFGLAITVTSGLLLAMTTAPLYVLAVRFIEGIGAGLFVAAAMSYVNADPDHVRLSGYLMACMNAGLVAGLLMTGWLAFVLHLPASGILLFSLMALVPAIAAFFAREPAVPTGSYPAGMVTRFTGQFRWLWYSAIVLIGITGVVSSLYPGFSGASSDILGLWFAGMSIATIAAVLIFSRIPLSPVPAIRWSAILMGIAVIITFFSAAGFLLIGALAGVVMIAQMARLAKIKKYQGVIMGLFSTMSYLGMAILPVSAGYVAESMGFFFTFCILAFGAFTVAVTIGRDFPVSES
ncbi:MAG: MFS transporter [Methanoregula sp.]|jgi:MFS family permease|nr:MFS transporter [Methanoregula sp.]